MVKNPIWLEATASCLFTTAAVELNSGLPRNNSREQPECHLNPGPQNFKYGALTTQARSLPLAFLKGKGLNTLPDRLIA